jgi:rhodanese-related sulfurtransferase
MNISKFLIDNIILIFAALASGSMLLWPLIARRTGGPAVAPFEATRLINREKGVVIDVSDEATYAAGHIVGSKHIPFANLEGRLADLPRDKSVPLIVVCPRGSQGSKAANVLRGKGYANAKALSGGLAGWREAGMPVEKTG